VLDSLVTDPEMDWCGAATVAVHPVVTILANAYRVMDARLGSPARPPQPREKVSR